MNDLQTKIRSITDGEYAVAKQDVDRLRQELGQPPLPSLQSTLEEKSAECVLVGVPLAFRHADVLVLSCPTFRAALYPLSHSDVASHIAHDTSSSDISRRYDYKRRLPTTQPERSVRVKSLTQRANLSNVRVVGQKAARTRNRNRSLALRPPPAHLLSECPHYAAL